MTRAELLQAANAHYAEGSRLLMSLDSASVPHDYAHTISQRAQAHFMGGLLALLLREAE